MKKLFALLTLVGMGAFIAGCAEEKPAGKSPAAGGGATATPGPKAGSTADNKADAGKDMAKDDMPADDEKLADDGDKPADEGDKPADEGDKPGDEEKPSE